MAEHKGIQISNEDPLRHYGPEHRRAVAWFFCAVALGCFLVSKLSRIDSKMYKSNAAYFDMDAWKENRRSQTTLGSESRDSRARGDLATIYSEVQSEKH